jgi:hypothetical protein
MREEAVGARIADILTTPLIKEQFHLLFLIENDFAMGPEDGPNDFVNAVRITVEFDFTFVNVSGGTFSVRLGRAHGVAALLGSNPEITVDDVSLTFPADDDGAFEIDFAPRQARAVRIRTGYPAVLPYVGVFPQPTVVRGGARISVRSNVKDRLSLFVGGFQAGASIADKLGPDDETAEEAWREQPSLSCEINTKAPLLPGEAVVLVVGA